MIFEISCYWSECFILCSEFMFSLNIIIVTIKFHEYMVWHSHICVHHHLESWNSKLEKKFWFLKLIEFWSHGLITITILSKQMTFIREWSNIICLAFMSKNYIYCSDDVLNILYFLDVLTILLQQLLSKLTRLSSIDESI